LPLLSLDAEPFMRVSLPSRFAVTPTSDVPAVIGAPNDGLTVVVVDEEDDCAKAALVIMPSAAAPASRYLVMGHAFQKHLREGVRLAGIINV
jgi:hypothetical protein